MCNLILHVYETKWFWICCVNEDMDRKGYKSSLFILVLKGINENERFSSNVLLCSTFEY